MFKFFAFGDAPFFFTEQLKELSWSPRVWDLTHEFGRSLMAQLWIDYPIRVFIMLCTSIGLDWWAIDKILWIGAVVIAFFSMWTLSRFIYRSRMASILSIIIYCFNTYALMLFEGGQRGVMLAYALVPYVFYRFISSKDEIIKNGIFLALLITFDLRLAYLTIVALGIYTVLFEKNGIQQIFTVSKSFIVVIFLHAFWILPLIVVRGGGLSLTEEYTGLGMVRFLSVADFSHALTLLHPNWPENLFGKVYFQKPEFLILPIIAFSSLLKIAHGKLRIFHYFSVLILIGAFFAKGLQDPFGGIFSWCFTYIPGFVMFRDPTKFYLFIGLGYSLLIPYSLELIRAFCSKYVRLHKHVIPILFIFFWIFTIRPVFSGVMGGNFTPKSVPADYILLKDILIRDTSPSRTLWLPVSEKFAFSSEIHPIVQAQALFNTTSLSSLTEILSSSKFQSAIHDAGIKYVVVPMDVWKRIYLKNYTYDPAQKEGIVLALKNTQLHPDARFTDLKVFINDSYQYANPVPAIVKEQEYWVRVGLVVSLLTIAVCSVFLVNFHRRS